MATAPNWLLRGAMKIVAIARHPATRLTIVAIATVDQVSKVLLPQQNPAHRA